MGLVRVTILVATALWAAAEVLKLRRPHQVEPARRLWTLGLLLALVHAATAFHVAYGWSHEAALAATSQQTEAMTGLDTGSGLFVNYLFLLIWTVDAAWWWIAPAAYARRPPLLERARLWFFVFMIVNGAIVFAGVAARVIGVIAVGAVGAAWIAGARGHLRHA